MLLVPFCPNLGFFKQFKKKIIIKKRKKKKKRRRNIVWTSGDEYYVCSFLPSFLPTGFFTACAYCGGVLGVLSTSWRTKDFKNKRKNIERDSKEQYLEALDFRGEMEKEKKKNYKRLKFEKKKKLTNK